MRPLFRRILLLGAADLTVVLVLCYIFGSWVFHTHAIEVSYRLESKIEFDAVWR